MEISDLVQHEVGNSFLMKIPSSTEYLEPVRRHFTGLLSGRYNPNVVNKIVLAIDEALSNAMIHGNRRQEENAVVVRYTITEEGFTIRIKDNGKGFDLEPWKEWYQKCRSRELKGLEGLQYHQDKKRGGGMGLSMIHNIMDHVEFSEGGNEITMIKHFEA